VRVEADDGAGWPVQNRTAKRLRQTLPSGVKGSSVSPKKNAPLRSKSGPQMRAAQVQWAKFDPFGSVTWICIMSAITSPPSGPGIRPRSRLTAPRSKPAGPGGAHRPEGPTRTRRRLVVRTQRPRHGPTPRLPRQPPLGRLLAKLTSLPVTPEQAGPANSLSLLSEIET
jgi:hypothetical protein